jgi:hypothetical protein
MAKPKPKDIDIEKTIEVFIDYRKGMRNKRTALEALMKETGLEPEVAKVFLAAMKRENVTSIRGYSKAPKKKEGGQ